MNRIDALLDDIATGKERINELKGEILELKEKNKKIRESKEND